MLGINDKRIYEIVTLDEQGNETRFTYPTKETFKLALDLCNEKGVLIARSGMVERI